MMLELVLLVAPLRQSRAADPLKVLVAHMFTFWAKMIA